MTKWKDRGIDTTLNILDYAKGLVSPTVKLGVTGLSHSGKTVFITSMVHHLLNPAKLSFFEPFVSGRIERVYLEPHPNDLLPRFDYEGNLEQLLSDAPSWPESTHHLSQLRLTIEYQSENIISNKWAPSKLHIDIIDYPGEWLLDLPLLDMSYQSWSQQIFEIANQPHLKPLAENWLNAISKVSPDELLDEGYAKSLTDYFKSFLQSSRRLHPDATLIPPGRFLMPGDLEGSPALTFSPLHLGGEDIKPNTMAALMNRRFEAYKNRIIQPFYRNVFTRLDRQIVLVDVLSTLNKGLDHLKNLQDTLAEILKSFNPGANHWLTSIWNKKVDRLLFAATKADHLHHHQHDKLQTLLSYITQEAIHQARREGAEVKVQALSSLRATTEIEVEKRGQIYPALRGIPEKGETIAGEEFDGATETVIFPGDLPDDMTKFMQGRLKCPPIEILKFLPPAHKIADSKELPHIRLDRALNMLFGDKLT